MELQKQKISNGVNRKAFVIFMIIVSVIVGVAIFFRGGREESVSPGDSAGLVIGANAIYVAEQAPSRTLVVAVVRLANPGFVVVHEDAASTPGGILGVSELLTTGETKDLTLIPLSRMTQDGEMLYAMIHLDDGDGIFDALKDKSALDPIGTLPVMMIVTISAEADESGDELEVRAKF
jgi:hypothetical protein